MERHDAVPAPTGFTLLGYSTTIRACRWEDVTRWSIDLGGRDSGGLIAVDGTDLGTCLAAVIDPAGPTLVWSDGDGSGTPIPDGDAFAAAVMVVVRAVFPHLVTP